MSIQITAERCTGCSYCVVSCPENAITLEISQRVFPTIDAGRCTQCALCLYSCPNNVFQAPELETPAQPVDEQVDVVIIGAGIGGLMTAAGLTHAGKKVLVIEQMAFIGGKFTHLEHKGYAISTAAWTCPGPNSRVGKLCRQVGADIPWVTVHDVKARGDHWVVTRDGRRFRSLDETQETLVGGPRKMEQVHRWVADMYDPNVTYPDEMTAREYIQKFVPGNAEYENYVQTIITYCFASQTVDDFSAMETKRAIIDSLEQMADWGTAVGGTKAIIAALEKVVLQNGGKIVCRTRVKSILVEGSTATGVELADGRKISSPVVVHNAGLNRLIQLVGESHLPVEFVQRLKNVKPALVAALILGTHTPLLGEDHSLLHSMGWQPTLNCYAPTFFDSKLAPTGKHALDVFWVMEPPYNFRLELDRVLDQLRQIFPNFDDVVEMQVPMFFTGTWTAEMAHRMGQSGAQRLDPQTPIQNLYMVGYDCIGYGMAGDIIPHGVQRALHLILHDDQYLPADEKPAMRFNKWFKSQALKIMAFSDRFK